MELLHSAEANGMVWDGPAACVYEEDGCLDDEAPCEEAIDEYCWGE